VANPATTGTNQPMKKGPIKQKALNNSGHGIDAMKYDRLHYIAFCGSLF
jgi:hypothetical protein